MLLSHYRKIKGFDTITKFRLLNSFVVTVAITTLTPIIISMKGEYLVPWLISVLIFLETVSAKTNGYFVEKFNISGLYKLGIIVHISLMFIMVVYYFDPLIFVLLDCLFGIMAIAVFGSFSIALDVYQSTYFLKDVQDFKVVRNSIIADATLIGLTVSFLMTFFFTVKVAITVVLVYHTIFSMYLLYNINYIDDNMIKEGVDE